MTKSTRSRKRFQPDPTSAETMTTDTQPTGRVSFKPGNAAGVLQKKTTERYPISRKKNQGGRRFGKMGAFSRKITLPPQKSASYTADAIKWTGKRLADPSCGPYTSPSVHSAKALPPGPVWCSPRDTLILASALATPFTAADELLAYAIRSRTRSGHDELPLHPLRRAGPGTDGRPERV